MRTLAADMTPEAERVWIELLRAASPTKKIQMMLDANRTARALAVAGLKERHPGETPAQLRRRLADLWLGPELRQRLTVLLPGKRVNERQRTGALQDAQQQVLDPHFSSIILPSMILQIRFAQFVRFASAFNLRAF